MRKSVFPKRITSMIETGYVRGENARTIAKRINSSRTARTLKVEYKTQQIAAAMAWITMKA